MRIIPPHMSFMCEMYSNYQKFQVKLNKIYPIVFIYFTVYRKLGGEMGITNLQ